MKQSLTPKIFCIGMNKTGTTSLKKAFENLGYLVGSQYKAELLLDEYKDGDFEAIAEYCKTAQVFQDFPFSFPETYKILDEAFPNSKFILSIRDSADQWYNSLTKFHAKMFGNGRIPTKEDLMEATYISKGRPWLTQKILFNKLEDEPYDKDILVEHYEKYNDEVQNYFKDRPHDLLVINLSEHNAYGKFCEFLGVDSPYDSFPWENKTEDIINYYSSSEKWAEKIFEYIDLYKVKNIGIFGTKKMGIEIKNRLIQENIEVKMFLDNFRNGIEVDSIPVNHPNVLEDKNTQLDLIVISVIGQHYKDIINQIKGHNQNIKVLSKNELE